MGIHLGPNGAKKLKRMQAYLFKEIYRQEKKTPKNKKKTGKEHNRTVNYKKLTNFTVSFRKMNILHSTSTEVVLKYNKYGNTEKFNSFSYIFSLIFSLAQGVHCLKLDYSS